jgi:TonB family protein
MSNRILIQAVLMTGAICLAGCLSTPSSSIYSESEQSIETAAAAYQAYARGDCGDVSARTNSSLIQDWEKNELLHSMVLIRTYCQELDGDVHGAQESYGELIEEAPLSSASDDARERLRILRLIQRDPDYAKWIADARLRATGGSTDRAPVDRVPAAFPLLARAAGIEGYAVVEFGVTPRGDTDAAVIVDSQPPLLFDGAVLRAVREWRYTPDPNGSESARQAIRIVFRPTEEEPTERERELEAEPTGTESTSEAP